MAGNHKQSQELAATIELQNKDSNDNYLDSEPQTESKAIQLQVPVSGASSTTAVSAPKRLRVLRVRRLKSLADSYDNLQDQRMGDPFRDDDSDVLMDSLETSVSFSGIAQDLDRRRKKSKLLCESLVFIPFYFLFIWLLALNRDVHDSYLLENAIESRILKQSVAASDGTQITFNDITTFTYLWDWLIDGFIPIVLKDDWYNDDDLNTTLWHTIGYQTKLVGGFRLQQARGKADAGDRCYSSPFDNLAPPCQSNVQDKSDIECGNRANCTFVDESVAFQYQCDDWGYCGFFQEFNFFDFTLNGSATIYSDLLSVANAQSDALGLKTNLWFDEYTRTVSILCNFYNNNFKKWVSVDLQFDISLSGQVLPIDSNHAALRMDILNFNSSDDVLMLVLGVFYLMSVIGYIVYLVYRFNYHRINDVEMIIDEDEEFDVGNEQAMQSQSGTVNTMNNSNNNSNNNNNNNMTTLPVGDVSATDTIGTATQTAQSSSQQQQQQQQYEQSHERHHGSRIRISKVKKVGYFSKWDYFKRSFLAILIVIFNLCVIITYFIFVFNSTRTACLDWQSGSSSVDFDSYVPFTELTDIDDTFRSFVVVTLCLLTLSSVRYFQITNSGEAVFMALINAVPIIVSYLPIYTLSLIGFAIAGHWLFGMELEGFSTVALAFFSVIQINFGLLDVQTLWDAGTWIGQVYIVTVMIVFIPFLLNIFLAITINSWDDFLAFRKQLRNPVNSGISPVPINESALTLWYRLPLVQIREELLKMLLEEKLNYNQVTYFQVKQICQDFKLDDNKTKLILRFFWKERHESD